MAQAPEFVINFPTLFVAADWVPAHCVVPDGFERGDSFELVDWQAWCLLNFYRLKPSARVGQLAPAFEYRRSQIVLPQKAGKAPYTAAHICVEAVGPALFAGWAEGGELWDCRDHGCGCGWVYEYQPGEPMAMPWPTPLIQITATSEEQTDNIYDALRPMIDDGPLSVLIPKTGEEFIRLPNKGRIDVVTSSARSRLGQRVTFVPQDETGVWTPEAGMVKVAETQRRGLAGMGGRAEETTNAWNPAEHSVAQRTAESERPDIFRYHPQAPAGLSYTNKQERRRIHRHVYRGCRWIDLDAIEAEAAELIETDAPQAERFYGNRAVAGAGQWIAPEAVGEMVDRELEVQPGSMIALGFDGSENDDHTALWGCTEAGDVFAIGIWTPAGDDLGWRADVMDAVDWTFETFQVVRFYLDPPYWQEEAGKWAAEHSDPQRPATLPVVEFWTNVEAKMAVACGALRTAIAKRTCRINPVPLRTEEQKRNGKSLGFWHFENARKKKVRVKLEDQAEEAHVVSKERRGSPLKIDSVTSAVLARRARDDALKLGEFVQKTYGRASWR